MSAKLKQETRKRTQEQVMISEAEVEKHLATLLPEVREVLNKSQEERIRIVLKDYFIAHTAVLQVIEYLELLMKIPKKPRMKGLILYGESGTGKTMLVHEFQKKVRKKNQS